MTARFTGAAACVDRGPDPRRASQRCRVRCGARDMTKTSTASSCRPMRRRSHLDRNSDIGETLLERGLVRRLSVLLG